MKERPAEIRCKCGRQLGDLVDSALWIRRLGLVVQGGSHIWRCKCGRVNKIDLVATATTTLDARIPAAVS